MFDRNKNEPSGGSQESADATQEGPVASASQPHPAEGAPGEERIGQGIAIGETGVRREPLRVPSQRGLVADAPHTAVGMPPAGAEVPGVESRDLTIRCRDQDAGMDQAAVDLEDILIGSDQ